MDRAVASLHCNDGAVGNATMLRQTLQRWCHIAMVETLHATSLRDVDLFRFQRFYRVGQGSFGGLNDNGQQCNDHRKDC